MSRDDWETGETLLTPYIEIGIGIEPSPRECAHVNVYTFRKCLGKLIPARSEKGSQTPPNPFYSVYGVVNNPVESVDGEAYANINEPPISRTLMGYLEDKVMIKELPRTHRQLI